MEINKEPQGEKKWGKAGCLVIVIVIFIVIALTFVASMDYYPIT